MSDSYQDLVAIIRQIVIEVLADMELNAPGHLIEYDVDSNMARVLLPTRRAVDDNGEEQVMETGWLQMPGHHVGDGFGDQYCWKGGATKDEPEKGEQVKVDFYHRESGMAKVSSASYNDKMKPPGANQDSGSGGDQGAESDTDGTQQLQPGERIIKHESGSFVKFYENGDVRVTSVGKIFVQSQGDVNVDVLEGDVNVTVEKGDVSVDAVEGDIDITADKGDITVDAQTGSITLNAKLDLNMNIGRDWNVNVGNVTP